MRVLILNWRDLRHPQAGGAEVWAQRVAEELSARGHQVTHFSAAVEGAPTDEVVNMIRFVRAGSRFTVYRHARRFLSRERMNFDVVLEEINTRPFFVDRWSNLPSVPMIHQIAGDVWSYEMTFPLSLVGRYVLEPIWLRRLSSRRVMTLSPSSADSLVPFGILDSVVVLPGSDLDVREPAVKYEVPTVAFLGRLTPSKRPGEAIRAFEMLKREFPEARMIVLGGGSLEEKLRARAPEGVEIRGFVSAREREEVLSRSHVLVTTTVREGWGLNVSEAASYGTPTIGYDSPGLVDSITMAKGGLVSQHPDALGNALLSYFRGEFNLVAAPLTRKWKDVAIQIERELSTAIATNAKK